MRGELKVVSHTHTARPMNISEPPQDIWPFMTPIQIFSYGKRGMKLGKAVYDSVPKRKTQHLGPSKHSVKYDVTASLCGIIMLVLKSYCHLGSEVRVRRQQKNEWMSEVVPFVRHHSWWARKNIPLQDSTWNFVVLWFRCGLFFIQNIIYLSRVFTMFNYEAPRRTKLTVFPPNI